MKEDKLVENQDISPELLGSLDPTILISKRDRDVRYCIGFLFRMTKPDSEKLKEIIKEKLPNAGLFYMKIYAPDESIYLLSKTEIENAKLEKNRKEIEGQ